MSNGFLSQEEIDALLNGDGADSTPTTDSAKEANLAEGVDTKDIRDRKSVV